MLDDTLDSRAARLNDRYRHHAATEVLRRAAAYLSQANLRLGQSPK